MPHRVLIVTTAPDPEDELRERLRERLDDAEVFVVAPTSDVSPLEWLADDVDRVREEAERRAELAAAAAPGKLARVEIGDPDPLVAIEDALRRFPADEIVLVTRPEDEASWLELDALHPLVERFGLPIVHVVDDDAPPGPRWKSRLQTQVRTLARGDGPWVAFIVQNAVAVAVASVTATLIGVVAAIYFGTR